MTQFNHSAVRIVAMTFLASGALLAQVPRDRLAAPSVAVATGTATISGRMTVMTATGAAPVRRARVVLESDALKQPLTTDTDTDGRYRFTALPAGRVRVHGEKDGFVAKIADPRRAFEPSAARELKAGQSTTIDLPMQSGAALDGRILKENGDPAMNVVVSAVRMAYDINGRRSTAVRQVKTDDLGRFRVHTLPPGEYQLDAAPDPLDANRGMPTPGPHPMLSRTYYPGSARLEEARTVALTVGQTAGSLDFTMTSVLMASLRGKVVSSDGRDAIGSSVRLQRVGGRVGEVRGSGSVETNDFAYAAVPAGEFWMMGVARPAPGGDAEFGVTRVTMDGRDVPNLTVTTAKPPAVNGRVEGVSIMPGLEVAALETAYEWPAPLWDSPWRWTAPVATDGSFAFKALPGPRLLRVNGLPRGVAVKGIWLGDVDVTDAPFEIESGQVPPPIRILLTAETATVSGVVKDATGKMLAGARVVIFSGNEQRWGTRSRMILSTETQADGTYEIAGVIPGAYRIVASSFMESLAWTDAAVLRQLALDTNIVNVSAGTVTMPLVVKR